MASRLAFECCIIRKLKSVTYFLSLSTPNRAPSQQQLGFHPNFTQHSDFTILCPAKIQQNTNMLSLFGCHRFAFPVLFSLLCVLYVVCIVLFLIIVLWHVPKWPTGIHKVSFVAMCLRKVSHWNSQNPFLMRVKKVNPHRHTKLRQAEIRREHASVREAVGNAACDLLAGRSTPCWTPKRPRAFRGVKVPTGHFPPQVLAVCPSSCLARRVVTNLVSYFWLHYWMRRSSNGKWESLKTLLFAIGFVHALVFNYVDVTS